VTTRQAPVEEAPSVALAIYAHPDDGDVSSGGTLARWADAGCEVHLLVCARGDKGSVDPTTDPTALTRLRREETEAAARVLGVHALHHLDRPDGELENDLATREEIVAIIREVRPEALVCPDPLAVFFGEHYYNHRDHRVVGFAALDAAAPAAASPLYFPSAERFGPAVRERAEEAGRIAGVAYAEAFRRIRLAP
jgi:LmbE family N-acetylglucosaminyl deacetylase